MNIIEYILQEWSYRCHDGLVDVRNPDKVTVLEEILKELRLENNVINQILSELDKDNYDITSITNNIQNNTPFNLPDGTSKPLSFISKEVEELFLSNDSKKIFKSEYYFKDDQDNLYSLEDIANTKNTTTPNTQNNPKDKIYDILSNPDIEYIDIQINKETYTEIDSVNESDNIIILKSGSTPKVYIKIIENQNTWGNLNNIEDKSLQDFANDIIDYLDKDDLDSIPEDITLIRSITSEDLYNKIIFGYNFGKQFSKDNVNYVLDDDLKISKVKDNLYKISNTKIWENSSNNNPKLNLSLVATFKKGQNDLGVKNCLIEAKNNFDKGTKI
jgi:hypothetical protein